MGKTILLLSDNADDVSFLAQVSSITGSRLQLAANVKSAIETIVAEDCSAIFISVDDSKKLNEFEIEAQKRFGLFSDQVQPNKFHFMSNRLLHENKEVILSPFFGTYYQRDSKDVEMDASFYGRFVLASEQKSSQDLKCFLKDKVKIQNVVLTHTDQKQEAAEAVRQYLIKAKVPARISNVIANTVDELLMNAIFDAPCDHFGKNLYSATARSESRVLLENEKVKMSIGFDGFYVGVSVSDEFGSLDRARLLNHVVANYKNRDYMIKLGQAGAGLGIATIFHSGGSMIYHCDANQKTEVTLLYRVYPSYRDFKNQFRFFSAKFYA